MSRLGKIICFVVLALLTSGIETALGGVSCEEVRLTFATSQIGKPKLVPTTPRKTANLDICVTSQASCCTRKMESKYRKKVGEEFDQILRLKTSELRTNIEGFLASFQEDVQTMVFEFQNSTLFEISTSLDGQLHFAKVHNLATRLFRALIKTSKERRPTIKRSADRFFDELFVTLFEQSTARKMTSQQVTCVLDQAKRGDFFDKKSSEFASEMSKLLHKSNVFAQALQAGLFTIDSLLSSAASKSCMESAVKMEYCSHCFGYTLIKPCQGLCTNVARGCLVGTKEIDFYWKHYIKGLRHMGVILTSSGSDVESILRRASGIIVEAVTSEIDKQTIKNVKQVCKITKSRHRRSLRDFPLNEPRSRKRNGGKRKKRNRNVDLRKLGPDSLTSSHTYDPRGLVKPPYEMLRDLPIPFYPEVTKVSKNDVIAEGKIGANFLRSRDSAKLHLNTKITRFLNFFNLSSNFFSNFADELCDVNNPLSFQLSTAGLCWDGRDMTSSYDKPIPEMDLENQFGNPEVTVEGIHGDVINAIESLRIGAKELFSVDGTVPRELEQPPYYVTDGLATPPCGDDEDSCGSGEFPSGDSPTVIAKQDEKEKIKEVPNTTENIEQSNTTSLIMTSSIITTTSGDVITSMSDVTAAGKNVLGGNNSSAKVYKNNLFFRTLSAQFFVFLVSKRILF